MTTHAEFNRPDPTRARDSSDKTAARLRSMRFLVPIGRLLFASIFIIASLGQFSSAEIQQAASVGVPAAGLLVPLAGVLALVGGLSVLFGYKTRYGAALLVLFLVPVTLVMHRFWGVPDPQMAMIQKVMFMKNIAMLGGALLLMYFGGGPDSIDTRLRPARS